MRPRAWGLGVLLTLAACSSGTPSAPSEPAVAVVLFTYRSDVPRNPPPLTDPDLIGAAMGCAHHNAAFGGVYVLQGSWSETNYRNPDGDCHEGCTVVVTGIPAGVEHVVRMRDLGLCNLAPRDEPIAFHTILANGVELRRVVDHPSGMKGAAFRVSADGGVTP